MPLETLKAAETLVGGECAGETLVLDEPLSFWGGLDPRSGRIVDEHHPQCGELITHRILVIPGTRGSTSASGALAEALRAGTGPIGFVLPEANVVILVAVAVVQEVYGVSTPIFVLPPEVFASLRSGQRVSIDGG